MLQSDSRLKALKYTTITIAQGYEHITIKWNEAMLFSFVGCGQDRVLQRSSFIRLPFDEKETPFLSRRSAATSCPKTPRHNSYKLQIQ
jgi:hypothetical protein